MPKTVHGLHYITCDLSTPWHNEAYPVVFHHGIGTNRNIWGEWIPIIAARYPVICFDMRGFGESVVPPEEHLWSMEELVADLWEVVDRCDSPRVHLVGESMGGTVMLAAAIDQPDRVASVAISNATFRGNGIGELPKWEEQFSEGVAVWSNRMMENRFFPEVLSPPARAWFDQEQKKTLPHVAVGLGKVLAEMDRARGATRATFLSCETRSASFARTLGST